MALEKVLAEAIIQGCVRKENAWDLISDFARYPQIMENVDKVEILERHEEHGLSRWHVSVDGAPLSWLEKDWFNHAGLEIRFKSTEGDFDAISGRWRITDTGGAGIKIWFAVEYDLGIPALETALGPVLRQKMQSSMEKMVRSLQQTLCTQATDERAVERRIIERNHMIRQHGTEHPVTIVNISAGGMLVRPAAAHIAPGALQLSIAMLDIASVVPDEQSDTCRILFTRPLEEEVFVPLCENLLLSGTVADFPKSLAQDAVVCTTEKELPLQLLELTAEGMSLSVQGAAPPRLESFSIGSTPLPLKRVVHDGERNMVNVYFQNPLNSQQLQQVREYFKAA